MFNPVELKKGSIYLIQCDHLLTTGQKSHLRGDLKRVEKEKGVEFIVLDGGVRLACSVDIKGLSIEEVKKLVEELKC